MKYLEIKLVKMQYFTLKRFSFLLNNKVPPKVGQEEGRNSILFGKFTLLNRVFS